MMRQVSHFPYAKVRGARLVELPYKGGLSMIVVLPDALDGLPAVEDRIGGSYAGWIGSLEDKEVDLALPPLAAAADLRLRTQLEAMGIRRAFAPAADFSGMARHDDLCISEVVQKAWIKTNEEGTEAASVTMVLMANKSLTLGPPPPPVVFHADHPFLYLIRDVETGVILFAGRIVKPAE
jgi:serpin B